MGGSEKMRPGRQILKTTSCAIPQIQRRAKNHKGTKRPKKKEVKKEVFEEGSDRIRSRFWKDDAVSRPEQEFTAKEICRQRADLGGYSP